MSCLLYCIAGIDTWMTDWHVTIVLIELQRRAGGRGSGDENWMSGNQNATYTITSGNSLLKRGSRGGGGGCDEVEVVGDEAGINREGKGQCCWKGISNMKGTELWTLLQHPIQIHSSRTRRRFHPQLPKGDHPLCAGNIGLCECIERRWRLVTANSLAIIGLTHIRWSLQ